MAFIVNRQSADAQIQKIGKDLMNHTPVDDLYGYNSTIMEITALSKNFYTQYVSAGREYWKEVLNRYGFAGVNYGESTVGNANPLYEVPITQFKEGIAETDDHPTSLYFSIMEITDPFDVTIDQNCRVATHLRDYINLGLFPLVAPPMSSDAVFLTFEKWDNLRDGRRTSSIGTIIDINLVEQNDSTRFVATIMWHPDAISIYGEEIIRSKNGFLKLADVIQTPKVWYDLDTSFGMVNIGVPIFEFTPFRQFVSLVSYVDGFEDYMNEALVTGHIHLDFVQTLLNNMAKTVDEVSRMIPATQAEEPSEESVNPEPENGVAFENACNDDEFGHRLRLYASDYDDVDPNEGYSF